MKRLKPVAVLAIFAASAVVTPAAAQQQKAVDSFTCKEVMRSTGDDRDATIAFLHGFLLAKSGGAIIDIEVMSKQTDVFVERCLDNPLEKAIEAMAAVKK